MTFSETSKAPHGGDRAYRPAPRMTPVRDARSTEIREEAIVAYQAAADEAREAGVMVREEPIVGRGRKDVVPGYTFSRKGRALGKHPDERNRDHPRMEY